MLEEVRAGVRAHELLCGILDEKQRASYLEFGWFDVVRPYGIYRIGPMLAMRFLKPGTEGAVDIGTGMFICINVKRKWYDIPLPDVYLAKLLMVEYNEELFWKTANSGGLTLDWAKRAFMGKADAYLGGYALRFWQTYLNREAPNATAEAFGGEGFTPR